MCKFCDDNKLKNLLSYNNVESMPKCMGEHKGISVFSNMYMQGNMLLIDGDGSYRSESDIFYESQGLEIDNEVSAKGKMRYIKIKFCPFCGRKLDNKDYEYRKALDDQEQLKQELEWLKLDMRDAQLHAQITWKDKKVVEHRFNALGENGEYKNDMSISEIKKNKFRCLKGRLIYGVRRGSFHGNIKDWRPDVHIECHHYGCGTFYSDWYIVPVDHLDEFCNLTKVVKDNSELEKLLETKKSIEENISKLNKKIVALSKHIETLKAELNISDSPSKNIVDSPSKNICTLDEYIEKYIINK